MTDKIEIFGGFSIKNYYRYLLYLAGIILIASYFFEAKAVTSIQELRSSLIWIIGGACFVWAVETIIDMFLTVAYTGKKADDRDIKDIGYAGTVITLMAHLLAWVVVLLNV